MKRRLRVTRRRAGAVLRWLSVPAAAALLGGCQDPNFIGVQDYGSVNGRVIDAKTKIPVNGAIVSVGSLEVQHTVSDGTFLLDHVPTGTQTLLVQAPGYRTATLSIAILKGGVAPAGLVPLPSVLPGAGPVPTSTVSLPPGLATAQPNASPTASAQPGAAPSPGPSPSPSPSP
jgi:hypothetical protein